MGYERLRQRLLEFLNSWATATEVGPGRIEVTLENPDGSTRGIQILMTPDEWDEMVAVAWGDFDAAAAWVKDKVLGLANDERFLIYETYDLHPSATPTLPADPEEELLAELTREHPEGIGHWVATDRDGIEHRFPEPPPGR